MALAIPRGGTVTEQHYFDAIKRQSIRLKHGMDCFRICARFEHDPLGGDGYTFMADEERDAVAFQLRLVSELHSHASNLEVSRTIPIGRPELLMTSKLQTPVGILLLDLISPTRTKLRT